MQPVDFLFLSDGRLFIRHASGEIIEAEPSDRGHAASLMLVLDEIATVDPARGLKVLPPVQNWLERAAGCPRRVPGAWRESGPRSGNFRRGTFDKAATEVGLPGLVPHELRLTAASLAIASGAWVKGVQAMLGHGSATLTLDRYGHLFGDELDAVPDRIDVAARQALERYEPPAARAPDPTIRAIWRG